MVIIKSNYRANKPFIATVSGAIVYVTYNNSRCEIHINSNAIAFGEKLVTIKEKGGFYYIIPINSNLYGTIAVMSEYCTEVSEDEINGANDITIEYKKQPEFIEQDGHSVNITVLSKNKSDLITETRLITIAVRNVDTTNRDSACIIVSNYNDTITFIKKFDDERITIEKNDTTLTLTGADNNYWGLTII